MNDLIPSLENSLDRENSQKKIWPWLVTVLIAAWIIAMGILGAGYLISKEISRGVATNLTNGSGGANAPTAISNNGPVDIEITDQMYSLGSEDAPVTMIEFADFQCPFCAVFHRESFGLIKENYIDAGLVRYVHVDLPFLGEESFIAAEAAACASDQDKFWQYHDLLYQNQAGENQNTFSLEKLKSLAGTAGLNTEQFNSCFDGLVYQDEIIDRTNIAQQYSVNSTPTFFINGMRFEGVMPYENFVQVIETELVN